MKDYPLFTVFTPTFNRATTLGRVYDSLCRQTFRGFEWLIVDDGSCDGTAELVGGWQENATFPIRYFWQENGGKHRAFNRGVREACGELFLTLDSDDACVDEALARLKFHWEAIPLDVRSEYSADTALCMDQEGRIIGDRFPGEFLDADSLSIQHVHRIAGEKWGFQRTEVLRRFPFPEFPGESFVPESLVWNRIAQQFRTRYINEALRIYVAGSDSLSRRSVKLRIESPCATLLYYRELLMHSLPFRAKFKAAVNLVRFSLHGRRSLSDMLVADRFPLWVCAAFWPGYYWYRRDLQSLEDGV